MLNVKMQQKTVNSLSPKIIVIGVGGAGGNAVNNMIASQLEGCEFLVCNTDAQALEHSLCDHKLQLGVSVTGGLGAGSKPEIGQAAAEESLEEIMQYLEGANMAFVTAGMGGGTGTGAAPVIAKACRELGILTVGVVTKPFHFEGSHRMEMADQGISEMQSYVDTLIVIPNQNLFRVANEKTTFADGFKMADSVLQSGVRGVTDLMVRPGLVNLDFADIRTAMLEMGKAMMGTGEASGERRAIEAAEAAINNPLLDDVTMKGARGVIINVTGGYDMTLFEADEACNRIRDEVDPNANIIFGATFDENMEGVMRVSIVSTGIERESALKQRSGGGKNGLSRATPSTSAAESAPETAQPVDTPATTTTAAPIAATAGPRTYRTGADNLKGITAPAAYSPAPESATDAQVTAEPSDADMFEQSRYESDTTKAEETPMMRGTRYKDSFIPPKPMVPEPSSHKIVQANPAPVQSPAAMAPQQNQAQYSFTGTPTPEATSPSGLVLNPPKARQTEHRQQPAPRTGSSSFLSRLADSVQHHLGLSHEEETHATAPQQAQPRMSSPSLGESMAAPAQGQLNIDAPAAQPKTSESDLDIPAFLRRQAN